MKSRGADDRWWEPFYDELLAETLLVRETEEEVEQTLDFLVKHLELDAGARVLDQCCGIGSLANPLARRGFRVIGVDQSAAYVERARGEGVPGAAFTAADAGTFRTAPLCAAGFNWWTSYGYAPSRDANVAMLKGAAACIAPGGRFLLDTMNLAGVLRGFEEETTLMRETPMGSIRLVRTSEVDLSAGRLLKRWVYSTGEEEIASYDSSLMLSMPHDLQDDLHSAGFEVDGFFGGVDGRPLTMDEPRCIVSAWRVERP